VALQPARKAPALTSERPVSKCRLVSFNWLLLRMDFNGFDITLAASLD
jgi:hypothetical protein